MANEATLADLNLQMNQDQEVLGGWDAVMNLLESAVNAFFLSQWNAQTSGSGGKMEISGLWCEGIVPSPPSGQITVVTQHDIQLGSPLFQFQNGQDNVTVTQQILGGTLKQGSMSVQQSFQPASCGCQVNDGRVTWGPPMAIDTTQNPVLSGTVALAQLQGLVNSTAQSLVLDFARGSFTVNNMTIKGVDNSQFADEIKNWFNANNIKYILASVDFRNLASMPALTPTSFQFNVKTTNAGNTIVQLLITTDGTTPASAQINVDEPIPTVDGATCSLMISSRILFQNIFVDNFNAGSGAVKVQAVGPASDINSWHADVISGSVSTPELIPGNQPYQTDGGLMAVTLNANTWSLVGSKFVPFGTLANYLFVIQLTSDALDVLTANVSVSGFQTIGPFPVPLTVTLGFAFNYSVGVSGHELQINPPEGGVNVAVSDSSGQLVPAAVGSSTASINASIQAAVSALIEASIGAVSFEPVSIFALQNLIFPGNNMINMTALFPFASTPGDLLIVGTMGTGT